MKLGNIEIGTKKGFHSLPVDVDNNTSSGFGFCQPLFSKFLEEGEALKLNFAQEVLLSPTVCPSYARMSVHNQARFVKMCDIFLHSMRCSVTFLLMVRIVTTFLHRYLGFVSVFYLNISSSILMLLLIS